MDFLFSRLFWGGIIVLFGLSIILNTLFKINIPLFKIVFALVLIYFGITMLVGSFRSKTGSHKSADVFSSSTISVNAGSLEKEYSAVFGSQTIDFTQITDGADKTVELNAIFGSQKVYVNENTKIKIKANAVFGQVSMPDNNTVSFGDGSYSQEPVHTLSAGTLFIDANAVFGEVRILKQTK